MADQVLRVPLGKLGTLLRKAGEGAPEAVAWGILQGAGRARAILVRRSPVFDGHLKNAWQVIGQGAKGATIINDAPHAGIIERGARPHTINREGIDSLREWVRRKVVTIQTTNTRAGKTTKRERKLTRSEAEDDPVVNSIVWAIATKMKKEGYKGTFFVRNAIPDLVKVALEEVERALHEHMRRSGEAS